MNDREDVQEKWLRYTRARDEAETLRYELLISEVEHIAGVLHAALNDPRQRLYSLEMISQVQPELRKEFLPDLLDLASFLGPHTFRAREIILSFPRDWLLANIASAVAPVLQRGGDEEYRRIIELFLMIDNELARKLVLRATTHEDAEVRAVGRDFLSDEAKAV
jgi:hypothetical protein